MTILVIAEHDNQSLKASTLNTVAAAGKLGGDVHVLVAGAGCAGVAEAAAKVAGVAKVLVCDAAHYEAQTAENVAELVKGLAAGYSHVLAPATPAGKNMLPRVAALLDVAQISEIVAIESPDTFVRPIYAGNALATVKSADAIKVITVRTTAFDAAAAEGNARTLPRSAPIAARNSSASSRSSMSGGALRICAGYREARAVPVIDPVSWPHAESSDVVAPCGSLSATTMASTPPASRRWRRACATPATR